MNREYRIHITQGFKMKTKKYCKNCIHFKVSNNYYCNVLNQRKFLKHNYVNRGYQDNPIELQNLEKSQNVRFLSSMLIAPYSLNSKGDCKYYIRKWWKFWVK